MTSLTYSMDLLPSEMIIEICNNLQFEDVIRIESWSQRYMKIVRETKWIHHVEITTSRELNGFGKYNLGERTYPGIDDPELMAVLSKLDYVSLDKLNTTTIKFLSDVREINISFGYKGDLNDWRYLESVEKIHIDDAAWYDPFNDEFRNQLNVESRFIDDITIRKSAGRIIKNANDFFNLTTKAWLNINSEKDSLALANFTNVKCVTIYICDANVKLDLRKLSNATHIDIHVDTFSYRLIEDNDFRSLANVKKLDLHKFTYVTNLAFKYLGGLTKLYLSKCDSICGSMLKYTPNLKKFIISECNNITNNAFESIGSVNELCIYDCKGIDGQALQYLSRIKFLALSSFVIDDDHLASLVSVKELILYGCKINSNKFNVLPNLNILELSDCDDTNDDAFVNLSSVTKISLIRCNNITNDVFYHMPNVTNIVIRTCSAMTIDVFEYFRDVHVLRCSFKLITPYHLSLLTNITDLELSGQHLTPGHLTHLANIEKLSLLDCKIDDYDGTDYLPNLQNISLNECAKLTSLKMRHFNRASRIIMCEQYELKGEWFRDFTNLRELKCTADYY